MELMTQIWISFWYGMVWWISNGYNPCLAGAPFDPLPLAILLNLLVVVAHSADMPQLLLPWLPYGNHSWEKETFELPDSFGRKILHM